MAGGAKFRPSDWMVAVSPARMEDGRILHWHPPQAVAFNLMEAKRHLDRGAPRRRSIMGNLKRLDTSDGNRHYMPVSSHATLDCLSELNGAVLHAFTAIESLANHTIDELDDDAEVEVERGGGSVTVGKADMVRRLNITEKFELAVPQLPEGRAVKGTAQWGWFVHLKRLRDDLVHVKELVIPPIPTIRRRMTSSCSAQPTAAWTRQSTSCSRLAPDSCLTTSSKRSVASPSPRELRRHPDGRQPRHSPSPPHRADRRSPSSPRVGRRCSTSNFATEVVTLRTSGLEWTRRRRK
jgi:hypothetical protein